MLPCLMLNLPSFFQEREIAPVIADYWERAEFPFPLVPGFQARFSNRIWTARGVFFGGNLRRHLHIVALGTSSSC